MELAPFSHSTFVLQEVRVSVTDFDTMQTDNYVLFRA